MKEKWLKIKETWSQLASREQQMLIMGGIAVTIFVIYQFIWSPLLNATASLRERIVAQEKTLRFMQTADKKIRQAGTINFSKKEPLSPVLLLSALQKQVDKAGVAQYLTQLKQANNDQIEMKFQKVVFDDAMSLIISMSKEESVRIVQMTVLPLNNPGVVDMDLFIRTAT